MLLRNFSRAQALFASLLLALGIALPLAWLLDDSSRQALAVGAQEQQALHLMDMVRQEMGSAEEDLLSGEGMKPVDAAQLLQRAQSQMAQAKEAGNSSHLILDPQLDIYYLSYLSTVKLPERLGLTVELADWERQGKGKSLRGSFLRESLLGAWQEETRALDLALDGDAAAGAQTLHDQDHERRERLDDYRLGQPLALRELARADLRFWQLCDQRLDQALTLRQQLQRDTRRLRLGLGAALLLLLETVGWLLQRRLTRQEVLSAQVQGAENYKTLYQAIPEPAFVYDLENRRFTNANPAAAQLLEMSAEDLVGMSLAAFIPAERRESFIADLKRRDPRAESREMQHIQTHRGRLLDVEVIARYIELEGRALRLVLLRDVTESRAAQEALRKNEERFRALIEDSSEALILMSPEGKVLYASQSSEGVSGYSPEERVGSHSNTVLHPDDREQVWKVFQQALADPSRSYSFESRFQHKQGHYIHTAAKLRNRLADPAIGALVLNYRDVTAERLAERQLLRLERMAAIGQTTAGLAHEVRNPLAIISARAEFLRGQLEGQPGQQEDLDSILRQVERLKDLVNQVLERARSEDLQLKDVDAGEVLESALRAAQIRYGSLADQVSVARDIANPAPQLRVDLPQIERVLLNLILNALQAMGSGGALTLSARREGAWALLSVADNGPGIPEARLSKVFEPFFTTKQTGSGLGLWICKSIVDQHRGTLEVENLKPQGCRFNLRLPLEPVP
jgi:PAS domain S-box-containing protein